MPTPKHPLRAASPVALRVRALRQAMGYSELTSFAKFLGVERGRLNNVEVGAGLGINLAHRLKVRTGVTLDWLYDGDTAGLPTGLLQRMQPILDDLGAAVKGKGRVPSARHKTSD